MAVGNVIDIAILRQLLRYEPETGKLYWLPRPVSMFKTRQQGGTWNTRYANTEAFTSTYQNGYGQGCVQYRKFLAHRVAWALYYGSWPDGDVDHINGVRTDNRIANLRCVTRSANLRNQKRSMKNTSGVTGVVWDAARSKWKASIKVNGKNHHLGRFDSYTEAVAVRKSAEVIHNFHPNHGRSAT